MGLGKQPSDNLASCTEIMTIVCDICRSYKFDGDPFEKTQRALASRRELLAIEYLVVEIPVRFKRQAKTLVTNLVQNVVLNTKAENEP